MSGELERRLVRQGTRPAFPAHALTELSDLRAATRDARSRSRLRIRG